MAKSTKCPRCNVGKLVKRGTKRGPAIAKLRTVVVLKCPKCNYQTHRMK